MRALKRGAALRRELPAADRIPYRAHVAPRVIRTEFGDYLQAFRLSGASFESSDDAELNNWHERLTRRAHVSLVRATQYVARIFRM
jgi:type IV secretion system protein VirB4